MTNSLEKSAQSKTGANDDPSVDGPDLARQKLLSERAQRLAMWIDNDFPLIKSARARYLADKAA